MGLLDSLMQTQSAPFTMRAAFVEAVIERGKNSYDLGAVNGMANSLTSLKMKLLPGCMASTVELTLNPPFEVAKRLIESGVLGIGFTPVDADLSWSSGLSMAAGMFEDATSMGLKLISAGLATDVKIGEGSNSFKSIQQGQGVSLRVRWWYDEFSKDSISPTFYGILKVPRIAFGEEISITLQAGSAGPLALSCLDDVGNMQDPKTVYDSINDFADLINMETKWGANARSRAMRKKLRDQQDLPLLLYMNEILAIIGCQAYFGSDKDNDTPLLEIMSFDELKNEAPVCTLCMYGQIDPNGKPPIYPIYTVDADISAAMTQGAIKGSNHTAVNTNTKTAQTNSNNVNSYDRPVLNKGIEGALPSVPAVNDITAGVKGSSTRSGFQDKSAIENDDNPDGFQEKQELVNDALDKAFEMTMTGPAIPWLTPNMLVKVDVGGIRHLTGTYQFKEITHDITPNGAEATYVVYRNFGLGDAEAYGLDVNEKAPSSQGGLLMDGANLVGGLIA